MGFSRIFGAVVKGELSVQHFTVLLTKVFSDIFIIGSVDESRSFIVRGGIISNKSGVTYAVKLISPTEVEVTQSSKKATTTISFSVVSVTAT